MTIASALTRKPYDGNGSTVEFDYPFEITDKSHLEVWITDPDGNEIIAICDTDYTVSGVGDPSGGKVTYPITGDPLASGWRLTVRLQVPLEQGIAFANQGGFFPKTHEDAFDRLTQIAMQQQDEIDRSIKAPISSDETETAWENFEALRDETVAARDASQGAQTASETAQGESESARDTSVAAATDAEASANLMVRNTHEETATAAQTTITVPFALPASLDNVGVYIAGARLPKSALTRTSDTVITMATPLVGGEKVEVLTAQIQASAVADSEAARDEAQAHAATAGAAATAAGDEATAAAGSATAAGNSESKAEAWADADQGVEVETGKYSAKHWAEVASTVSHTHANIATLGKFSEDVEGKPTYDGNAIGGDPAEEIHAATAKTTLADADELGLIDSAASWALKKLSWSNIKSALLAYFISIFSNPNLLINTDGTNPFDQRENMPGTNIGTGYYPIDRWHLLNDATQVDVAVQTGGGTRITCVTAGSATYFSLIQRLENYATLSGKPLHLKARVRSNNSSVRIVIHDGTSWFLTNTHSGGGQPEYLEWTGTIGTATMLQVYFDIPNGSIADGSYFEFEWIKLEHGSTHTLFLPPKDKAEVERECLPYCERIQGVGGFGRISLNGRGSSSTICSINIPITRKRDNTYTVSYGGNLGLFAGAAIYPVTGITLDQRGANTCTINVEVASGLTAGVEYELIANNDADAYMQINNEVA